MKIQNRVSLNVLLGSILVASFSGTAVPVSAASLTWDGSDGSWTSAGNWLVDGTTPSASAPANGDAVTINAGTVTSSATLGFRNMTVNLNGGTFNEAWHDIHLYGGTVMNQTGGTLHYSKDSNDRWLNIGETPGDAVAVYNFSGGVISNLNYLCVGRRGPGQMNITGTASATVGNLILGYAPLKSGDSTLTIDGGSLTVTGPARLGGDNTGEQGNYLGTSSMLLRSGTFTANSDVYVGKTGNFTSVQKTLIDVSGGTWTSAGKVYLGVGGNTTASDKNLIDFNISGGTADFKNEVHIGSAAGTTAVMHLSGGTSNFAKPVLISTANGANGTLKISGGTNTFSDKIYVGYIEEGTHTGTGTLEIAGDAAFSNEILVGYGAAGNLKLTAGNIDFNKTDVALNIGMRGAGGKMEISGTADVYVGGSDLHIGNGAVGQLLQSGGKLTTRSWLNIGEGSMGTYDMTGGQLVPGHYLVIGRRSKGVMNVSGTADVDAKDVYVGYFSDKSDGSELNISGGTFDGHALYVGNQPHHGLDSAKIGTGTVNVSGGTVNFVNQSFIGHRGQNTRGGIGILNVSDSGNITFGKASYASGSDMVALNVGYGEKSTGTINVSGGNMKVTGHAYIANWRGTANVNVSGGKLDFAHETFLGQGGESTTRMNVTGGETVFQKIVRSGYGDKSDVELNVSGGTVRFNGRVEMGWNQGSSDSITITGGTVYGPNADFILGAGGGVTTMSVGGNGTYSQNGKGNFIVNAASNNGETGTLLELKENGTIDTLWFSLGQNLVGDSPCNTFNMTGGTLKIGGGNFRIGYRAHSTVNVWDGDITVGGDMRVAFQDDGNSGAAHPAGADVNIYGSGSTWSIGRDLDWKSTGNVNFIADGLKLNADGSLVPAVSTVRANGIGRILSSVTVDTSKYFYDGAAFMGDVPNNTVVSTTGTLTWDPASLTTVGEYWDLQVNGNTAELVFNEELAAEALVADGLATAKGNIGESGWVTISGTPNSDFTLLLHASGEGDLDELAEYLTLQMAEANSGITAEHRGEFIAFTNLTLDDDGLSFMNYDLSAFNAQNGSSLTFNNLPEPGTWILLLSGTLFLFWRRARAA
ncbi:MAG: PEP-CTERM sorting domain-containing protein [Thermoguttaceae bacterium]|nr:PEP-CTERM sorting domain-containing protein [Thermoguttaceae bacterium]